MKNKTTTSDVKNKKQLPVIVSIIKIENKRISVLWNTGEIKVIEFEPIFEFWKTLKNRLVYEKLENYEVFSKVKIKFGTLFWQDIKINNNPVSIDPESLYQNSESIFTR